MRSPDELMAAASAQTGLDDFGDDSFRPGLEILVQSLREEASLNAAGEEFMDGRLTGRLVNRLEIEDWYRRNPEIDAVAIKAPLFGLGLPRTGSTPVSFLLSLDPDVRYLRFWESNRPCPPPSTVTGPNPRISPDILWKIGTKNHIPMEVEGPIECTELMGLDFRSHMDGQARTPTYSTWVTNADLTSTYRYEQRVLKLLQWGEPTKPWRLKAPRHMMFLPYIDGVFPDARFVMTHRDPTDVILSICDVLADNHGPFTRHVDLAEIGRLNVAKWSIAIQRLLEFRADGNDHRFYDIDFQAMRADPIGQIHGLYEWLGAPVTEQFEARMRTWWDQNSAKREPRTPSEPGMYGLDLDEVRPLFSEYAARSREWTAR